jgi:hypothetical protein
MVHDEQMIEVNVPLNQDAVSSLENPFTLNIEIGQEFLLQQTFIDPNYLEVENGTTVERNVTPQEINQCGYRLSRFHQ